MIAGGLRVQQVDSAVQAAFLLEPPGWTRLEPQSVSGDPTPGVEARIHDPLWLLSRQWQLGEFQGEDAGSPVTVTATTTTTPVGAFRTGAKDDGEWVAWRAGELLEPIIEREPEAARGPGLRQRAEAGAQLLADLEAASVDAAVLRQIVGDCPLTVPWADPLDYRAPGLLAALVGRVPDAEQVAARVQAGLANEPPQLPAWFDGLANQAAILAAVQDWHAWYRQNVSPLAGNACWVDDRLEYGFGLAVAEADAPLVFEASAFGGGRVEWYDLDQSPNAPQPAAAQALPQPTTATATLLATPLRFSGMPAQRYWQFEDGEVNLGAIEAQPHDLARLALVEFAMVYANDWLVVPVDVPDGSFVTTTKVEYTTTFGEQIEVPSANDDPGAPAFRLFEVSVGGTTDAIRGLVVPPAAPSVLEGPPREEVLFLRDELANMAWGVERSIETPSGDTRSRSDEPRPQPPVPGTDPGASMDYQLENEVPRWWIPFLPVSTGYATIALRKGAMLDDNEQPVLPLGLILEPGAPLVIADEEIPREGARVRRVPALARRADGSLVRWITRRVSVGRGEGVSGLAFDTAIRRQSSGG